MFSMVGDAGKEQNREHDHGKRYGQNLEISLSDQYERRRGRQATLMSSREGYFRGKERANQIFSQIRKQRGKHPGMPGGKKKGETCGMIGVMHRGIGLEQRDKEENWGTRFLVKKT